jgi:uncharacterized protein YsxB (DUF464 family)
MLKVHAQKNQVDGSYRLKLKGHCGYLKEGKDIVCSAASILCLTMAQTVKDSKQCLECEPKIILHNGKANITFKPKAGCEKQFELALCTVMTGFKVLQHEYPDYIQII